MNSEEKISVLPDSDDAKDTKNISGPDASDPPASEPTKNYIEAQNADLTLSRTKSEKPYTAFSPAAKWFIVVMTAMASFFSPLSGQIYFPVLPILTKSYHLSESLINVSVTTYMIFQGLAPSFMGTFSDASGRRLGYILAFTIYTGANIGLALQDNYAALLILRCLQSAGSSGTISFGYGVIADIATTGERGKYFGPMAAGVLTAPALGPTIGGLLTQFLGWRSVFWFLTIISGGYLVLYIILMPETHRGIVDDGSIVPDQWWRQSLVQYLAARRRLKRMNVDEKDDYERSQQALIERRQATKIRFPNPLGSFVILTNPDAFCLIMYSGIMMFCNLVLMTSTATVFPGLYGLDELQVGLCFLPLGIAATVGSFCNGRLLDWNYRRTALRLGLTVDKKRGDDLRNFPIERARLQNVFFFQILQMAAYLPYGWALQKHASLAVPLVLQGILGLCLVITSNSISTLLSDIYPRNVSTASAASNLIRCSLGAIGAAVVNDMLTAMGLGWGFTFIGLLMAAAIGFLWVEVVWGMGWRQKRWQKLEAKQQAEKEKKAQDEATKEPAA
ncbi:putative MFS transporter [Rhizodiscina lignyota]|uniref:MFS transporter n=1 Tax=Rhizodiscina lignyota TaxID=1504668 RepID=A0A9P4M791_9PEZI|nr:putative MFS transporter [Rhizodiscina lignyota]